MLNSQRSRLKEMRMSILASLPSSKEDFMRFVLRCVFGKTIYELLMFRRHNGYWPNLKNPQTFSEKLAVRKLYNPVADSPMLADKWLSRTYVEQRVGSRYLNEVYFAGDKPEEIPFKDLPEKFVIRFGHNSGYNIVVTDKAQISPDDVRRRCRTALDKSFGFITNEDWYRDIKPMMVIERFLEDKTHGIPPDYKFFVFGGKVRYIQMHYGRFSNHTERFYDADWKPMPFQTSYPLATPTKKPAKLNEMMQVAETIAKDIAGFVRVDLYLIDYKEILFGEITLCPAAGWKNRREGNADNELGKWWK